MRTTDSRVLKLEEKIESHLFFLNRKVAYLPIFLKLEEVQRGYFKKCTEDFNGSPIREDSLAVINTGIDYIQRREEDPMRRLDGLLPFSRSYDNIQEIRYYIIHIITKRLRDLCGKKITKELVEEYECLDNFVAKIIQLSPRLFKSSYATGFHHFLSIAQEKIRGMKKTVSICFEKSSIPSHLDNIVNFLNAYRSELAALLVYLLSDAPHNGTFHADYLTKENDERIDPQLLGTEVYSSIRDAYLKKNPSPIKTIDAGNKLIVLLQRFHHVIKVIKLLQQISTLEGEWETARDETLNFILDSNLSIAADFLKQVSENADALYKYNASIGANKKYSAGRSMNTQYADEKLKEMRKLHCDFQERRGQIRQRVENIKALKPNTKEIAKRKIIKKTQNLVKLLSENLVEIPEVISKKINDLNKKNESDIESEKKEYLQKIEEEISDELVNRITSIIDAIELIAYITAQINREKNSLIQHYLYQAVRKLMDETKNSYYIFSQYSLEEALEFIEDFKSHQTERFEYIDSKKQFMIQDTINNKTSALEARIKEAKKNLTQATLQGIFLLPQRTVENHNTLPTPQQQSNIRSILILSQQLKHCNEREKFKESLSAFYQKIKSMDYKLHYHGGESINCDGNLKKVPAHIKKMLEIYEENINAEESLEYYQSIWESMSAVAVVALKHKSFQVRFFGARNLSTDHIYQAVASGYQQPKSWIAAQVP